MGLYSGHGNSVAIRALSLYPQSLLAKLTVYRGGSRGVRRVQMNPSGFFQKKKKKKRSGQAQAGCADPRMICVQSRDRSGHVLAPGLHIWNRTFLELTRVDIVYIACT